MEKIRGVVKSVLNHVLPGTLPKFLVVGAQKSGTTALHYYLSQHPQLVGSRPKEVGYFDDDENYTRGLKWYRQAFINLKNPLKSFVSFEATPEYLYRAYVPRRIYEFDPGMKIIILLRDPVYRAYSAWNMYRYFGEREKGLPTQFYHSYVKHRENNIMKELYSASNFPSFEEAVESDIQKWNSGSELEEPSFVRRGIYYPQVKRYFDLFPRTNVKIIGFKDLVGVSKLDTLNEMLVFLEMSPIEWNFLEDNKRNSIQYQGGMSENIATKLIQFFEPYNKQLFDLIGTKLNW